MNGVVTLELLGSTLKSIQVEQRTLRTENELMRGVLARLEARSASREDLHDLARILSRAPRVRRSSCG